MTRYFLGVDIGSSKSHAAVADEQGQVIGFGQAGAGNHESVGVDGFTAVVQEVVQNALADAQIDRAQIAGAGFGIAGYDWESDDPLMHQVISTLALNAPYKFVNDSVIGLIAGAKHGWGVSIVAGTSCNCCGRNRQGKFGRVTGNGPLFGEYGGGHELVDAALAAISRAWTLRAPQTMITDIFVAHFGAKDTADLLEGVARGRYIPKAKNAPLVFQAVQAGDLVALSLIDWISKGLADMAIGVIRQIEIADQQFEVVLAGSFYKGTPIIADTIRQTLLPFAPNAEIVRLDAPPVAGAVLLGMEQAGVDFPRLRDQVIATIYPPL